jgi:nucleotide-binding universal stress UspA family protein
MQKQNSVPWLAPLQFSGDAAYHAGAIEAHYCYLIDGSRATKEILQLARACKCDTVVVGKDSLSWLRELLDGNPAEELVRQGKGFTIWVIE